MIRRPSGAAQQFDFSLAAGLLFNHSEALRIRWARRSRSSDVSCCRSCSLVCTSSVSITTRQGQPNCIARETRSTSRGSNSDPHDGSIGRSRIAAGQVREEFLRSAAARLPLASWPFQPSPAASPWCRLSRSRWEVEIRQVSSGLAGQASASQELSRPESQSAFTREAVPRR